MLRLIPVYREEVLRTWIEWIMNYTRSIGAYLFFPFAAIRVPLIFHAYLQFKIREADRCCAVKRPDNMRIRAAISKHYTVTARSNSAKTSHYAY